MEVETTGNIDEKSVNPSYSFISEAFRHVTAGPLQCSVFCGGRACKYERSDVWEDDQMAVPGLFSHWVTDKILAMARPNCTEIKKNDMIESFKKQNIKTVINLQECGEHASCGYALHASGFSYDPQQLMDNDIFYYNYNIQDYSVPLQRTLLDICKVLTFAHTEGAVAVHCHAGLGRTGVVIACFLIYHHKMKPKDAILLVRKNRPRSIQTRNQLKAVFKFALYLTPLWVHFPLASSLSLEQILERQKSVLHGVEGKTLKFTPKIVFVICSRVLRHTGIPSSVLCKQFRPLSPTHRPRTCQPAIQWNREDDDDLDSLNGEGDIITGCTGDVKEIEEMERQMSPRGINCPEQLTIEGRGKQTLKLEEGEARTDEEVERDKSEMERCQEKGEDGVLRRCISADAILMSEKTAATAPPDLSLNLCHRLHLSPRSSLDATVPAQERPTLSVPVWPFIAGILGQPEPTTSCDLETVIRQINVGIWESVLSLTLYQLGVLLVRWVGCLPAPLLSPRHLGNLSLLGLEGLSEALDMLPPSTRATLHCLTTTMTALLYGPLLTRREDVLHATELLICNGLQGTQVQHGKLMGKFLRLKHRETKR